MTDRTKKEDPEHVILKLEGDDARRFRAFKEKTFITSNRGAARKMIIERLDAEEREGVLKSAA